jgi:hypothetical protein
MFEIVVVNKPNKGRNGAVYCARGGRGVKGSPLANPRRIGDPKPCGGVYARGETIDLYDAELGNALDTTTYPTVEGLTWGDAPLTQGMRAAIRAEMNRLYTRALAGRLELDCFCAPHRCHCECIATRLRARLAERAPVARGAVAPAPEPRVAAPTSVFRSLLAAAVAPG